jgi:hypothetical protein
VPRQAPRAISSSQLVVLAYPSSARPVSAQLAPTRVPTFRKRAAWPLEKLEATYPAVVEISNAPTASSRKPKVPRIEGQATPSSPSGRPRLMKARLARMARKGNMLSRLCAIDRRKIETILHG